MTRMEVSRILLVLLTFSGSLAQEDTNNKYFAQLKLSLREEKIPSIVNYFLNNTLEELGITTPDIIQLSKLDQYDENDLINVFSYFNITNIYTVDNLETLFNTLKIDFGSFYKRIVSDLELSRNQVQYIIGNLSIPSNFHIAVAMDDYSDIYEILKQGEYDQSHMDAAISSSGKTASQIYSTARDILYENVILMDSTQFMTLLKENGWTHRTALQWYQALNITTPDVYAVEKFRAIFTNISDSLNRNKTIGVFVENDKVAIHAIGYENLQRIVDDRVIKIEANQVEVSLNKIKDLGENIVEVSSNPSRFGYIEVVENYNQTVDCTYATVVNDEIVTEDVEVQNFRFEKTENTVFIVGSPLVCQGLLYGLAREETNSSIIFDKFFTEENPPPTENPTVSIGTPLSPLLPLLTFAYFIASL